MEKLKIGVIGVGNISRSHIKAYLGNPNVELYALCDINEERLKAKGEQYGVTRLFTDEAEMLRACPEIDAVSVCTWNSAHAPATIMALEAGKHVLCEKPMATNAADAQKMLDTARRVGKKLMVGFVRRFGNDAKIVRDFIDAGNLGNIYYAKASYLRRNGCPGGWFSDKSRSGGGPLIDLGVHVIDLVRYFMGCPKPVSVYGATYNCIGNRDGIVDKPAYRAETQDKAIYDVEDMATAMIRFDNGAVLTFDASFNLNIKEDIHSVDLFGSRGGLKMEPTFELYTDINNYLANVTLNTPTEFNFGGSFQNEINFYVDAIRNDIDTLSIAEDGVTLMKILDAIYLSAKTGKEVAIQ